MYKGIVAVWMTGQRIIICAAEDCCKLTATSQIALPVVGRNMHSARRATMLLLDTAACKAMSKYFDYTAARRQDEPTRFETVT
jgi:hypothetical protein